MIDIKLLREKPEIVRENIKKKGQNEKLELVDKVIKLDSDWRKIKTESDMLRAERNSISKKISEAKKIGGDVKLLMKKAQSIPDEIAELETKMAILEGEIESAMAQIPNIMWKGD